MVGQIKINNVTKSFTNPDGTVLKALNLNYSWHRAELKTVPQS